VRHGVLRFFADEHDFAVFAIDKVTVFILTKPPKVSWTFKWQPPL